VDETSLSAERITVIAKGAVVIKARSTYKHGGINGKKDFEPTRRG
jgi:hypothetical protein